MDIGDCVKIKGTNFSGEVIGIIRHFNGLYNLRIYDDEFKKHFNHGSFHEYDLEPIKPHKVA